MEFNKFLFGLFLNGYGVEKHICKDTGKIKLVQCHVTEEISEPDLYFHNQDDLEDWLDGIVVDERDYIYNTARALQAVFENWSRV